MLLGTSVLRGFGGALGTELFAGPVVPRASSRQRLCREDCGLCREQLALGKAMDSGSVQK
jgi:hypothetical protein